MRARRQRRRECGLWSGLAWRPPLEWNHRWTQMNTGQEIIIRAIARSSVVSSSRTQPKVIEIRVGFDFFRLRRRDAEDTDLGADPDTFDGLEVRRDRFELAVVRRVGERAEAAVAHRDAKADPRRTEGR